MSDNYKSPTNHSMIFLHGAEVSASVKLVTGPEDTYPVVELGMDTLQFTIFPKGKSIVELGAALSKAGAALTKIAERMAVLSIND